MQNGGAENHGAQPGRNQEPRGNRNSIEKGVAWSSQPAPCTPPGVYELVAVCLFTKMEMARPSMFKVMNNEVSQQNQRRAGAGRPGAGFPAPSQ